MKKGVDPLKVPIFGGLCQDFKEEVKSKREMDYMKNEHLFVVTTQGCKVSWHHNTHGRCKLGTSSCDGL